MASSTIRYAPAEVVLTIGGVRIMDFAPDSFITVTPVSDIAQHDAGASGTVAISFSSDKRATLSLSLMQGSKGNEAVSKLAEKQLALGSGGGVAKNLAVVVKNTLDGSIVTGDALITKMAAQGYGAKSGTRDWELILPQGLGTMKERAA